MKPPAYNTIKSPPRLISAVLLFALLVTSCDRVGRRVQKMKDFISSKSNRRGDTAIDSASQARLAELLSIQHFIPEFKDDSSIKQLIGTQTESFPVYVYYLKYIAPQNKVLAGMKHIIPDKKFSIPSDDSCTPTSIAEFNKECSKDQKDAQTAYFWNFSHLKKIAIYGCFKAPFRHYIIFDKNSDTVYHRIEEIMD